MDIEVGEELYLNPSPAGGGGGQNITHTQTNPVVPSRARPISDAMLAISTALQGAPVNFGRIPGLDAPNTQMPIANLGSLLSNPYFGAGASRGSPLFSSGPIRPPNTGGGYGSITTAPPEPIPSTTPTPTRADPMTRRDRRDDRRDQRRDFRIQRREDNRANRFGTMLTSI